MGFNHIKVDRERGRVSAPELRLVVLAGAMLGLAYAGLGGTAVATSPQPAASRSFALCGFGARIDCVVDGDTFWLGGEKIRIADIDTPETHPPRCAEEAALGARATRRLQALLNAGPFAMQAADRDQDRYGRKLRIVVRDGRSLGDTLVAEGLARQYKGRRLAWCA